MKEFNNIHNNCYETIDGKKIWESRSVAVNCIVVLKKHGEFYVLIGKRGKGVPDNAGKWNLPSGYIDYNETGTEASYREVWEETGIDIDDIKGKIIYNAMNEPWDINTDISSNKQNISLRYGILIKSNYFPKFSLINNEPDEVETVEWVNLRYIKFYNFAYEHDKVIINFKNNIIDWFWLIKFVKWIIKIINKYK